MRLEGSIWKFVDSLECGGFGWELLQGGTGEWDARRRNLQPPVVGALDRGVDHLHRNDALGTLGITQHRVSYGGVHSEEIKSSKYDVLGSKSGINVINIRRLYTQLRPDSGDPSFS